MSSGWIVTLVICIILALTILYSLLQRQRRNAQRSHSNVVRMSKFKKKEKPSHQQQKCSYCKKKTDRLTFYAGVHGSAVGVCRDCKPKAEKQDLLQI